MSGLQPQSAWPSWGSPLVVLRQDGAELRVLRRPLASPISRQTGHTVMASSRPRHVRHDTMGWRHPSLDIRQIHLLTTASPSDTPASLCDGGIPGVISRHLPDRSPCESVICKKTVGPVTLNDVAACIISHHPSYPLKLPAFVIVLR